MGKTSAGILMYRYRGKRLQVLLLHPGGPFWARKDAGAWSIPKGEFLPADDPLEAAIREFEEETGTRPSGSFTALAPVRQKGGKTVHAWALHGDLDAEQIRSNTFEIAWPPGSAKMKSFPEVDKAGWFDMPEARIKILQGQLPLLAQLQELLENKD